MIIMKHINFSTLLTIAFLMVGAQAFAYDAKIGGIYYNFIDSEATVTFYSHINATSNRNAYIGDVAIPGTVVYHGISYKVTSIGEGAFCGCQSLNSVSIPEGVTSIGENVFGGCTSLKTITIPEGVTTIGRCAFDGCSSLESISIPESVNSIGQGAFSYCSSLKSLIIPEGVESIGSSFCFNCTSLMSITLPKSLKSIGTYAFCQCSKLTTIILPEGLLSIGESAFSGCNKLTSINIPRSLAFIDSDAFKNCTALSSVHITDISSWCSIEFNSNPLSSAHHLYLNGDEVHELMIPNGVEIINNAFWGCEGLTSVVIPASVTSIGLFAFRNCPNLISIISLNDTPCRLGEYAFTCDENLYPNRSIYSNATLYVPNGSEAAYRAKNNWKRFSKIEPTNTKFKLTYLVNDEEYKVYEIQAANIISKEPEPIKEGFTFSGWDEIPELMPMEDVTVRGTLTANKYSLIYVVDGEEFKASAIVYGTELTAEAEPIKEGYAFSGWSEIPETMPAHDVKVTGSFNINSYNLTYRVDGKEYKKSTVVYGAELIAEAEPTKDGYTFSGWGEIPKNMPAHDVEIMGSFSVNSYNLIYRVDGKEYEKSTVVYGTELTAEAEPTKEGHTFSGWSEIPEKMPAHDVEVTGSFSINSYTLTYKVDGEEYKTSTVAYGTELTAETEPSKEGHTFSGWSWIPKKMPAEDVIVVGTFNINSYTLTYKVDGEEYKTSTVVYGTELTAETEPTMEGYTFSGWSEIPEKMPAHDVEVTGSFSINSYTLTYKVDGEEYKTSTIVYGAELTAETEPTKEGYTFCGWSEIPEKMPAHDVEVTGSFSINSYTLTYKVDGEEYKTSTVVYGAKLTTETEPTKEGYTFCGWSEIPEKMPAHDVEVTGSFSVNKYTVTFKYGEEVLSTATVNYGEEIPLPESLDSDRYTLVEWLDVPATMPAHDITIQANFTDGISSVGIEQQTNEPQYYDLSGCKLTKLSKGINIVNGKKVLVK